MLTGLSQLVSDQGDSNASLRLAERALDERKRLYGPESQKAGFGYSNLGFGLEAVGNYRAAVEAYQSATRIFALHLHPDSVERAIGVSQLGNTEMLAGDLASAREHLTDADQTFARQNNIHHRHVLNAARTCRVETLISPGERAQAACEKAHSLTIKKHGAGGEDEAIASRNNGLLFLEQGRLTDARLALQHSLDLLATKGIAAWRGMVLLALAEIAWLEARPAVALREVDLGLKLLGDGFPPHLRRTGLALRALVCAEAPLSACSIDSFAQATSALDEQSYRDSIVVLPANIFLAQTDIALARFDAAKARLLRALSAARDVDSRAPRVVEAQAWLAIAQLDRSSTACVRRDSQLREISTSINATGLRAHPQLQRVLAKLEADRATCQS